MHRVGCCHSRPDHNGTFASERSVDIRTLPAASYEIVHTAVTLAAEKEIRPMKRNCGTIGIYALASIMTASAATITLPGNQVYGVAISGGNPSPSTVATAGGGSGNASPTAEQAPNAIDNNVLTK